ncbi:hypothetical protein ACIRPX_29955 [Streptomyces sp. NPDC101225]|uniref:hypothetical protein n=1 Tax=Streptomyces sp. NPDC101225 TaxID=3366135 RepID=UPI00381710B4
MSTEAQHASIPPRPSRPPAAGPDPAAPEPAPTEDGTTGSGTTGSDGVWSPWRTSEPFDAFARRGSAGPAEEEVPAERPGTGPAPDRDTERSQNPTRPPATSTPATGARDTNARDARTPDIGARDARTPDIGARDTRTPDTGARDANARATGAWDARTRDARTPDIGARDTRTPDTGARDARARATGARDARTPATGARDARARATGARDPRTPDPNARDTRVRDARPPDTGARDTNARDARTQDAPARDTRTPDASGSDIRTPGTRAPERGPRFPSLRAPVGPPPPPPPPQASARFPDAPPAAGREEPGAERRARRREGTGPDAPAATVPPRPAHRPTVAPQRTSAPVESTQESTGRLRPPPAEAPPVPSPPAPAPDTVGPDPALSWSAPGTPGRTPGPARPVVSFGQPEGYDEQARPRPLGVRVRPRTAAAGVCLVLGLGLIGGAVTGSWLVGGGGEGGTQDTYATAGTLWHSVPVDRLFPPTVQGTGAGPGGADRTWTRVAVAPDSGCKNAFDPLLSKALAPLGCRRLLRATYTDATQSFVTTVGLVFTKADAASMDAFARRFRNEGLGTRTDLMPRPYAEKGTAAARFGPEQRASWTVSVLTDAPVVVYAVSGWADGRSVDTPVPAEQATQSGATSAPAQAGLGNEAQGLADRIERSLRKDVTSPTEKPS